MVVADDVVYKYRGEVVELLTVAGNLRQIAHHPGGGPFWVKAEKLKQVQPKKRKAHQHQIPDISADPFVAWLLQQRVYICGNCPERKLPQLVASYLQATGENLTDFSRISCGARLNNWGFSLYVAFPKPPAHIAPSVHAYPAPEGMEISNKEFVLGLLALGLRFGSNQPLQKQ